MSPDCTLREHCSKHSSASAPLALLLQFKLAAHARFAASGGRCARTNDTRVHAAPDAADGLACDAVKQGECRVNDAESCVKFQPLWLLLSHVPCETAAVGIAAAKRHIRERRTAAAGESDSGGARHAALALRILCFGCMYTRCKALGSGRCDAGGFFGCARYHRSM